MVNLVTLVVGFGLMVILLLSVVFTVTRPERFPFVLGVFLLILGLTFLPTQIGQSIVAVIGVILMLASTVPLLRKQAAEV